MRSANRHSLGLAGGLLALAITLGRPDFSLAQAAVTPVPGSTPTETVKILPDVKIQDKTLDELVDYLRNADPTFNVIVVRDPDAPAEVPKLNFELRNVTALDVLHLVGAAYPSMEIITVATDGGHSVAALRIHRTDDLNPMPKGPQVKVFSLAPLLEGKSDQDRDKKIQESLDLIKQVIDETPSEVPVQIHVHSPTGTIIVRGTPEQLDEVAQAVNALLPNNQWEANWGLTNQAQSLFSQAQGLKALQMQAKLKAETDALHSEAQNHSGDGQ